MNRSEADDAIETALDRTSNKRNLVNPDILRAILSGIGLVIVPREATLPMLQAGPGDGLGWHPLINESVRENVWQSMIDAALKDK